MDSSDSEDDDTQRQQFLEAADPTLFTNAMYQKQSQPEKDQNTDKLEKIKPNVTKEKSQRHLPEDDGDFNSGTDIQLPETVRDHMYKKLRSLIDQQIEFQNLSLPEKKEKRYKSKVKLLKGADCYLKTDEELGDTLPKGPQTKPIIKRRQINDDGDDPKTSVESKLQSAAVNAVDIIEGVEVKGWAVKRERTDKMFRYKADTKGVLHSVGPENEFTKMRRKNKWSEAKIKNKQRKS